MEKKRTILTYKPVKLRRYNAEKRGSFEIQMWFYDHEVSGVIGALRLAQKHHAEQNPPHLGYVTWLARLEKKYSKALGSLLKVELKDLKLKGEKPLCE